MATLFSLHLGRSIDGFGKPSVKAVPAALIGTLCAETKDIVRPDIPAIREALPHYYRKAFDRSGGNFWYDNAGKGTPYLTLRNYRGKFLNTIYAIPYTFNPKV